MCLDRACHFAIAGDARALVHRSTAVRPMCFLDSFHFSFIFSPKLSNLPSSSFSPSLSPLRHSRPSPTFGHCHCRRHPTSPLPLRFSLHLCPLTLSLTLNRSPPPLTSSGHRHPPSALSSDVGTLFLFDQTFPLSSLLTPAPI